MNPLTYFREVRLEMAKVVWPKKRDVVKLTATVIILSAVVGVYLGGLDILFSGLLSQILAN